MYKNLHDLGGKASENRREFIRYGSNIVIAFQTDLRSSMSFPSRISLTKDLRLKIVFLC